MSKFFEDLKRGLEEAIAYEKGTGPARVTVYDENKRIIVSEIRKPKSENKPEPVNH